MDVQMDGRTEKWREWTVKQMDSQKDGWTGTDDRTIWIRREIEWDTPWTDEQTKWVPRLDGWRSSCINERTSDVYEATDGISWFTVVDYRIPNPTKIAVGPFVHVADSVLRLRRRSEDRAKNHRTFVRDRDGHNYIRTFRLRASPVGSSFRFPTPLHASDGFSAVGGSIGL